MPYTLALSERMAVGRKINCIESGDDLVPSSWSDFGRTGWVSFDGRLTVLFFIDVFDLSKN